MKDKHCAICLSTVADEDAPILTMSGSGVPRFLCERCCQDIDTATLGREPELIAAAMDRIAKNLSVKNIDDPWTVDTATEILNSSAERARKIRDGEYDFSLDEEEASEELSELPEELLESEEDRELDRKENEQAEKVDKFLNWVWLGVIIGCVGFMIWWFFFR